ncbi:PPE family protein [Mycobacterium nebraskense]|uniref:PPE family protein n=1 Tax=Mycobacterium nebraskense TaxID=244292 RepID=UPI00064261EC|nr:PPE family protein [Mycobacterium nebraskense]KLO46175.1 PPE family protein [Mycobacterium nebraskense]
MDFGLLPPEITSALIHSGPGAWSMIDAAGAWQELSAELEEAASSYAAELASLAGTWTGPSSTAMAQAFEPYLAWLRTTAAQCQEIAASVETVTAAFELTHWTVVHPSVVAANRARLALLLATNFFGINAPAIAETEAEYNAMWVNNSTAMYRYGATSLNAVKLSQFASPPPVANPTGAAQQANVLGSNAALTPAASSTGNAIDALGITPFDPNKGWFGFANTWGSQFIAASGFPFNLLSYTAQLHAAHALHGVGADIGLGLSEGSAALASADASLANALGAGTLAPRGAMGVSVLVGKLSMPPAVVGMLPGSQPPVQLASAVSALPPGASQPPAIPMAPVRPPLGGKGSRGGDGRDYNDIEYGAELPGTVMKRPPSAG